MSSGTPATSNNNNSNEPIIVWKHIGLYGYAVGTLAFYPDVIVWKSALLGRNEIQQNKNKDENDDSISTMTTRKIPASKLIYAKWTPMGKHIGLLRLGISNASSSSNSSKQQPPYQQDWRLDGFPSNDYDLLQQKLLSIYKITLQNYIMSSAGTQYGIPSVSSDSGKWLTFSHCTIQDDLNEEGQEFQVVKTHPICDLDLNEITHCVIPANNNRNEIELQFPESDTIEAGTDQLGKHKTHGPIVAEYCMNHLVIPV
jgi:hypothetical protein